MTNGDEHHKALVTRGSLLEACSQTAALLEPADAAFHNVALPVQLPVDRPRAVATDQNYQFDPLRHDPTLKPRERDRVEALLLSADGMRVPRLAVHFDCCQATVRRWLHQFAAEGLRSLRHQRRGLGPDVARRQAVRRALNGLLFQKRTWTAAQLAEALADKGLVMKPRTVRKYLKLMGARYVRTKYVLRHRQDPEAAAAARAKLDDFKKKPTPDNWTSSSSTRRASPSACPPPIPGVAADSDTASPTRAPRASA